MARRQPDTLSRHQVGKRVVFRFERSVLVNGIDDLDEEPDPEKRELRRDIFNLPREPRG